MKLMKIETYILVISIVMLLAACHKEVDVSEKQDLQNQNTTDLPSYILENYNDNRIKEFSYRNWEGILDERGLDPFNFYYPNGQVKEMKIWSIDVDSGEKELLFFSKYDEVGKITQKNTYNHGDVSSWNYTYDNEALLQKIEFGFNGNQKSDKTLEYRYYLPIPDQVEKRREIYNNDELIFTEIEQIEGDTLSLTVDYYSETRVDDVYKLFFSSGIIVKYERKGDYDMYFNLIYDTDNNLVSIEESSILSDEIIFTSEYEIDENNHFIKTIHDHRDGNAKILKTEKIENIDASNNWIELNIYNEGQLEERFVRDFVYY